MRDPLNRTKVVIRHLPPSLSQSAFFEQINSRFTDRYNWSSFLPGKSSYKHQKCARAYVNFNSPDDVFEFAEFFDGHVFVNEKGAQFKLIVEYAPSQRVSKVNAKKDGREGTIHKDPEYVEFLERISKPVECLPGADIQLERREAERAGIQEVPIVTPLMEYVRKKRASKSVNQHVAGSGVKAGRRSRTASPSRSRSSKQVSEKKKYVLKSSGKNTNGKDKSTYILLPQRENQMHASAEKLGDNENGSTPVDKAKKRILLLKGNEQEISQVSDGTAKSKVSASAIEALPPGVLKLNQRHDASGRIIRSILLNKEARQNHSSSSIQTTEKKLQSLNLEKGKRPSRSTSMKSSMQASTNEHSMSSLNSDYNGNRSVEGKYLRNEPRGLTSGREKLDRRTRSRERLDRGVWAPLRSSDALHVGDEYQISASDFSEAKHGESKFDSSRSGHNSEIAAVAGGHGGPCMENGSHRHFGRRGPIHSGKDDGSLKRGVIVGPGLYEKQVWIQKSASGS